MAHSLTFSHPLYRRPSIVFGVAYCIWIRLSCQTASCEPLRHTSKRKIGVFQLSLSSTTVWTAQYSHVSPRFVFTTANLLYLQESLSHIAHLNATHNFRNEKKSVFPHIICAFCAYQFGPESVQSSPHDPRNSNGGGLQPVSQMIAFISELIRRFAASFD